MRDDFLPEADQKQIVERQLLQDAQAGQPGAIDELVRRYASAVHQLAAYLLPFVDRADEIVEASFVSLLVQAGQESIDESPELQLAYRAIEACQSSWETNELDDPLLKALQLVAPAARNAWLLEKAGTYTNSWVANLLNIDVQQLAAMLESVPEQLMAAGVMPAEINKYFQDRISMISWSEQDTDRLTERLVGRLEEEKRRQRTRVLTLEVIWAVLGVALLLFGFQIFNSIGIQPGGGAGGFETQMTATAAPDLTEVTEETPEPTRTPLPYESTQANGRSFTPVISADGRTIVFVSDATNLVSGDENDSRDVFLFDRISRNISLVSAGFETAAANGASGGPSISGDGNLVVFTSWANNLIPGIENTCETENGDERPCAQVYLFDRTTDELELISQSGSVPGNGDSGVTPNFVSPVEFSALSEDGNVVAFSSYAKNFGADPVFGGLFIKIRDTGELIRVDRTHDGAPVNGASYWPSLSADGRYLAFCTQASNLVDDDLNNKADIYIYDRDADALVRITTGPTGTGANGASVQPMLSTDGRWLVFRSEADDLVEGDFNHTADIFLHDLQNGITALVSMTDQAVSADRASNLPAISGDGTHVGFVSLATDLAAGSFNGTWDLYLYAQDTRLPKLVSHGLDDQPANNPSSWPSLSKDGQFVVFVSAADNLVENDVNGLEDIFLFQRESGLISRINVPNPGGR